VRVLLTLLLCAAAARAEEKPSPFIDPDDGWFDVSGFLEKVYGAVPVIAPITEPAVGYGAAGALVFVDRDLSAGPGARPDLYLIGGLYTESQSWGAMGLYSGNFLRGDLHTLAGLGYFSLNLKYYGLGDDASLSRNPVNYNLQASILGGSAAYRIASTPLFAGLGVLLGKTEVDVNGGGSVPSDQQVTLLSFRPLLQFDTRDNIFTPTRGLFGEAGFSFIHQSDGPWFELFDLTAIGYLPLLPRELFLGVKAGAGFSFGDGPFYLRPYVDLRGAPRLRYQGEEAAEVEVELRWQFWKRFSLVGFGGAGGAWNSFLGFDRSQAVVTGGAGFRYELARKVGLHMGADFAFGKDGFALYIQFGSAWAHL